jgi:hypothetical protein
MKFEDVDTKEEKKLGRPLFEYRPRAYGSGGGGGKRERERGEADRGINSQSN